MGNSRRQQEILSLLQEVGVMDVNEIARHFNVTPTSIRRDLIFLEEKKYIKRSRGKASLLTPPIVSAFETRKQNFIDEKRRIAAVAAKLINPRESIIFDSGTTTYQLAVFLRELNIPYLSIITNSLPIAQLLSPEYMVVLSGGIVQHDNMALIGPDTDAYFKSVLADKVFIGATGTDDINGLTASSPFHVSLKKQLLKCSSERIALIDSGKFSTSGINRFCDFSEITKVITTLTEQNEHKINELIKRNVQIILA